MFILCAQVVLLAPRMCPHASGVMPLGARGFFMHFSEPLLQYLVFCVKNGVMFYKFGGLLRQFGVSCVIRLCQFGISLT